MSSIVSLFCRMLNWDLNSGTESPLNSFFLLANKAKEASPIQVEDTLKQVRSISNPESYINSKSTKNTELLKYKMIRVLGQGSFGKVVLVRHLESGQLFAMKIVKKIKLTKKQQITRIQTEKLLLEELNNHPFITKLNSAFQTRSKLYIVMEYCPGGELFFHLSNNRRFPESIVRFIAAEILLALEAIHAKGFIYRDLKPENILFDAEGHIRLCDFGLACSGISSFCKGANSVCGTPEYMSPEMLNKTEYGYCIDYWALGMMTYELLTGLPPWYTRDRAAFLERVKTFPLTFPPTISDSARSLIAGLLSRSVSTRLGVNGTEEIKNHPFFNEINWSDLISTKQIQVPFNPCQGMTVGSNPSDDLIQTENFDQQFTRMPLLSESIEENVFGEILWIENFNITPEETTNLNQTSNLNSLPHGLSRSIIDNTQVVCEPKKLNSSQ